ncbi:MAG: efflux RND transporter permease subunit [Leptospira sp.]|nr:efflux RND transporter permease subunit [Leptospira sp.]
MILDRYILAKSTIQLKKGTMFSIVEYFLKHPKVTNMVVIVVFLAGIFSAMTITRQTNPNISYDILVVTTVYPGASPEDVEINVTNKLEDQLLEVENIKSLTSQSMENVSIITLVLDGEAGDVADTKTGVRDAVARVGDFPEAVRDRPVIEELKASSIPVMQVAVLGSAPERELRSFAKDLEVRLREVPGVGRITKKGYRKQEVQIRLDSDKMRNFQVSFAEVLQSVRTRNIRSSGGTIESFIAEKRIITLSEYETLDDVRDLVVRSSFAGGRLRIRDIAEVREELEKSDMAFRANQNPAVSLYIMSQDNADIIRLSNGLQEKIKEFSVELPEGVRAEILFDFSIYTRIMIDMVVNNGLMGFVLVFLVLYFFMDRRTAFWPAFGIPFSILATVAVFPIFGVRFEMISLVTMILVLGIVVDDAIVVAEKIYSLRREGMNSMDAAREGVRTMAIPISAAFLTTVLAFMPIWFIGGLFGKFLYGIPLVVMLTLAASLIESIFFLPSHLQQTKLVETHSRRQEWIALVIQKYTQAIFHALQRKKRYLAGYIIALVLLLSIGIGFVNFAMNTDKDPDFFTIIAEAPLGNSIERTTRLMEPVEEMVMKTLPKDSYMAIMTEVGHHDAIGSISMGRYSNWAIITIFLKPAQDRNVESETMIEELKPNVERLKSELGFEKLELTMIDGGFSAGKPVDVIFISNDDANREIFEKELLEFLETKEGVSHIQSTNAQGKEELRLKLNYDRIADVGITAWQVAETMRTAFEGVIATTIRRSGEDVAYRVMLDDSKTFSEKNVLSLPISNNQGRLIPLSAIARLEKADGPSTIHHEAGMRMVRITADVDSKVVSPIALNSEIREKFMDRIGKTPGMRMKFGGEQEEMMLSMGGFFYALIVALISIYFILVVLFDSYSQPFLIMSVIPFALGGMYITLFMHGLDLTFIALTSLLGLIGVAVNDTIVMISHLNDHCSKHGLTLENIANGASKRFRPVLITTFTTFAGLLPTSYGLFGDMPDIRPLVLIMAWGLIFSTTVTLGFVPLLYSLIRKAGHSLE